MAGRVTLSLGSDEALVLFDWLLRFNAQEDQSFEDPAERMVLCRLEGSLESKLGEPGAPPYRQAVAEARARVRDGAE